MPRGYDKLSERYGRPSLGPFWGSRRGKLMLLAVFLASIGAGMAIASWAKISFGL